MRSYQSTQIGDKVIYAEINDRDGFKGFKIYEVLDISTRLTNGVVTAIYATSFFKGPDGWTKHKFISTSEDELDPKYIIYVDQKDTPTFDQIEAVNGFLGVGAESIYKYRSPGASVLTYRGVDTRQLYSKAIINLFYGV